MALSGFPLPVPAGATPVCVPVITEHFLHPALGVTLP